MRRLVIAISIVLGGCPPSPKSTTSGGGGPSTDLVACCRGCVAAAERGGAQTCSSDVAPLGPASADLKCSAAFGSTPPTLATCRAMFVPARPKPVLVFDSKHKVGTVMARTEGDAGGGASHSGHLVWGGSALMQDVKVVQVIWGAPGPGRTFLANVTDGSAAAAYKAYLESPTFDWLNAEYNISVYHIGHGHFDKTVTLSLLHDDAKGNLVTDGAVQSELGAQIDAGTLPNDSNTLFAINFPAEVTVQQNESSYTRGAGTVPTECGPGNDYDTGLCYPACKAGYHGGGPICYGSCPAGYHDDGATCRKDVQITSKPSYGRGAGTPPTSCGAGKDYDAGLCYPSCNAGYHGVGPVCWQSCKPGYTDDGATCRRDAKIISADNSSCPGYDLCGLTLAKGCSKCPAGYNNDGCTCRIDADIYAKGSYGRGAGTVPNSCGAGRELDAGLCYPVCNAGYHGVGPVCWGTCPPGATDDGATCRIDASIIGKPSYGRGAGTVPACKASLDSDAGLCYDKCVDGYSGAGPVCWGHDSFCKGNPGFCGFHSSFLKGVTNVRYAVLAEMGPGSPCFNRCFTGTPFTDLTKVFSHELIEAVTDPDSNLGWNDVTNGEIGDICNDLFTTLPTGETVQLEWSNQDNTCKL